MDRNLRANFINSVVGGQKISCPNCNTLNDADSRFCITCGTPIGRASDGVVSDATEAKPDVDKANVPFATAKREAPAVPTRQSVPQTMPVVEESSAFAKGLPAWDMVPPQIMVRRKKSR